MSWNCWSLNDWRSNICPGTLVWLRRYDGQSNVCLLVREALNSSNIPSAHYRKYVANDTPAIILEHADVATYYVCLVGEQKYFVYAGNIYRAPSNNR